MASEIPSPSVSSWLALRPSAISLPSSTPSPSVSALLGFKPKAISLLSGIPSWSLSVALSVAALLPAPDDKAAAPVVAAPAATCAVFTSAPQNPLILQVYHHQLPTPQMPASNNTSNDFSFIQGGTPLIDYLCETMYRKTYTRL